MLQKLFILLTVIVSIVLTSSAYAEIDLTRTIEFRRDKRVYYQMLHEHSLEAVKSMDHLLNNEEKTALRKVTKAVVEKVIELNPLGHIKHVFLTKGFGAGVTIAITELVTIGILPPILTAMGQPVLAGLSMGSPSFMATLPVYFYYSNKKQKKKIAKSLGFESVEHLDKLRKEILSFSIETRMFSMLLKTAQGQEEIHILNRKFAKLRKNPAGNAIDLFKIEKVFKDHFSSAELKRYNKVKKEHIDLYGYMLMQKIKNHPEASEEFFSMIKKQFESSDIKIDGKQQRYLAEIDDKLSALHKLRYKIGHESKKIKNALTKTGMKNPINDALVKTFFDNFQADLKSIEIDMRSFEYKYLQSIHIAADFDEDVFFAQHDKLKRRLERVVDRIKFLDGDIHHQDEKMARAAMENLLEELDQLDKSWRPAIQPAGTMGKCLAIAKSFFAKIRFTK